MFRLSEHFPYLVTRVGVRMGELLAKRLKRLRLTVPMHRAMVALQERSGQSLGDLSEVTSVEVSTLSRLVGTLQRRGLVSRTRRSSNGRIVEIRLTRTGAVLVKQLIAIGQQHADVGLAGLGPDTIDALKKNLAKVFHNLDALEREVDEEAREAAETRATGARRGTPRKAIRGGRKNRRPSPRGTV